MNSPRKRSTCRRLLVALLRFNEAAVNSPRKHTLCRDRGIAWSGFNEAAVNSPRKRRQGLEVDG